MGAIKAGAIGAGVSAAFQYASENKNQCRQKCKSVLPAIHRYMSGLLGGASIGVGLSNIVGVAKGTQSTGKSLGKVGAQLGLAGAGVITGIGSKSVIKRTYYICVGKCYINEYKQRIDKLGNSNPQKKEKMLINYKNAKEMIEKEEKKLKDDLEKYKQRVKKLEGQI